VLFLTSMWSRMSPEAKVFATQLDYSAEFLGCLLEAALASDANASTSSSAACCQPLPAPRLPKSTVADLKAAWQALDKDAFAIDFFKPSEADEGGELASASAPDAQKAWQTAWMRLVDLLLQLLEDESLPRLERITCSLVGLAQKMWCVEMHSVATMKTSFLRAVVAGYDGKEKRQLSRAWEAFCYTLLAPSAPVMAASCNLSQLASATAAPLPTPGGGPQAAAIAAQGVALLEMSLSMTAQGPSSRSASGSGAADEALRHLQNARRRLLDLVCEDVNAYCGLLATIFAKKPASCAPQDHAQTSAAVQKAEENERRRWVQRATEVPLHVAEVTVAALKACAECVIIKDSLKGDWLAGVKFAQAAIQVSVENVEINAGHLKDDFGAEVQRRLKSLKEAGPPWEVLQFGRAAAGS